MRILLIDDHALFRIGLQELLARRGIEVVAAEGDCELGIHLASEENPDVILLDMRMPKMSGIEVLKRLRRAGLEMPIAMLTTSMERQDLIGSLQQGAQGYLLKDMEPDELILALERIVSAGRGAEQQVDCPLPRHPRGHGEKARAVDYAQVGGQVPGRGGGDRGGAQSMRQPQGCGLARATENPTYGEKR